MCISIHALREEGDRQRRQKRTDPRYFYPRPPRGGRRYAEPGNIHKIRFLSTPSARRATEQACENHRTRPISIHALREEGDYFCFCTNGVRADFYPRPPRGGRLQIIRDVLGVKLFLSTPSARRATWRLPRRAPERRISIHALREEGDQKV